MATKGIRQIYNIGYLRWGRGVEWWGKPRRLSTLSVKFYLFIFTWEAKITSCHHFLTPDEGVMWAFSALKKHAYLPPLPTVALGAALSAQLPSPAAPTEFNQLGRGQRWKGEVRETLGIYSPSPLPLCGNGGSFQEVLSCQILDGSQPCPLEMLRLLNVGVRRYLLWFSYTSLMPLPYISHQDPSWCRV